MINAFSFEDILFIYFYSYIYIIEIVKHQKIEVKGLESDINIRKEKEVCKSERVINVDKELETKYKPLLQNRQDEFTKQQQQLQQQLQQQQQQLQPSQLPSPQQILPSSSNSSIKRETKSLQNLSILNNNNNNSYLTPHRTSSVRSFKSNKESHRSFSSSVVNQLQPVTNGDLTNTIEKQVSIMSKKIYKKSKRSEVSYSTLNQAISNYVGQPLSKDYAKEILNIFNNTNRIYCLFIIDKIAIERYSRFLLKQEEEEENGVKIVNKYYFEYDYSTKAYRVIKKKFRSEISKDDS